MAVEWVTLATIPVSSPQQITSITPREGEGWLPVFRVEIPLIPGGAEKVRSLEGVWRPAVESAIRLRRPGAVVSVEYQGDTLILTVDERGPQPVVLPGPIVWAIAVGIGALLVTIAAFVLSQGFFVFKQALITQEVGKGIAVLVDNPWFPIAVFVVAVIALTR